MLISRLSFRALLPTGVPGQWSCKSRASHHYLDERRTVRLSTVRCKSWFLLTFRPSSLNPRHFMRTSLPSFTVPMITDRFYTLHAQNCKTGLILNIFWQVFAQTAQMVKPAPSQVKTLAGK